MNQVQENVGRRWSALVAEGNQVRLLNPGGGYWIVFSCENEGIAEHVVRELKYWAKDAYENATFNRLCRAGD